MHTCALEDEVVKIRRVVEAFPLKFWCACGVQVAGLTSWCGSPMVVGGYRRCMSMAQGVAATQAVEDHVSEPDL